jgi:hypothetical protein
MSCVLYTLVSPEAHELLDKLWVRSGSDSRALFMNAVILSMRNRKRLPRGRAETYMRHRPVGKKTARTIFGRK